MQSVGQCVHVTLTNKGTHFQNLNIDITFLLLLPASFAWWYENHNKYMII